MSFEHIWAPKAVQEGQDAKYSATILIPKTDKETLAKINGAIATEQAIGWPNGKLPPGFKKPLKDGDGMVDKNGVQRKETVGCYVINASSKTKPGIVNAAREDVLDKNEVYSGCFCRFQLAFQPYNLSSSKGIGCYLNNIQKIKDGESLAGREKASDAFDEYSDNDDDV
jgi:hypothetical protein